MRCYFTRNGHITSVEELPGLTEDEATIKAHKLYLERRNLYDGFEVWDRSRFLIKHPAAEGDGP
jgi:hypothetical protein